MSDTEIEAMAVAVEVGRFLLALNDSRGQLDAWLEVNNEAECRTIISAAIEAARAAERDRAAKVCEDEAELWRGEQSIIDFKLCAAAIRALK